MARTYLMLVFTMMLWSGTFIGGRMLGEVLAPSVSAFLRFVVASVVLLALVSRERGRLSPPPRKLWAPLFVLGASGIFFYSVCFFTALRTVSAGRASLFVASTPLVITCVSLIGGLERPSLLKLLGVLLSLSGTVIVIFGGDLSALLSGAGFGLGELALIGCVFSWALFTLVGRVVLRRLSPIESICWASIIGALLLAPLALSDGLLPALPRLSAGAWLNLAYLGVFGSALGISFYYRGVAEIGATRAGVFINLVPVFAVILSWLLLGEPVSLPVLLGGGLVIGGVGLTNL